MWRMARIVVLDDVPESVRLIGMVLQSEGHDVATVDSPARAFALLKLKPADLVIADQNMPGMTGEAFLERAAMLWPKMAMMLLTADMRIRPETPRPYPVMYKPFKIAELRELVKKLLSARNAPRS